MNVYGHRGAAGEAPENTIAGCLHAMSRGAKFLEVDLRVSKDDKLVVIHDATVNRTTYDRGAVINYTAAELAKMDARRSGPTWPRKKQCGVPTLASLLRATRAAQGYFLEVKSTRGVSNVMMASLLADFFPTKSSARKCVVMSMDIKLLHEVRELAPHIALGYISSTGDIMRKLGDYSFEHLSMHWSSCHLINTMMIRRMGVTLSAWTVNDPRAIGTLKKMKVKNVITDYPSMAVPVLASLDRKR